MIVCQNFKTKILGMEDRSRRNNIRVDEGTEEKGEKWEDCERKALDILIDKLGIENATIELTHKVKSFQNNKNIKNKGATMTKACKLLNYKDKARFSRKSNCLKGSSYCINEDFIRETLVICKDL